LKQSKTKEKSKTMIEHITIELETVNAAFQDAPEIEIARILNLLAKEIKDGELSETYCQTLRDINGNTVGEIKLVLDDSEIVSHDPESTDYIGYFG